MEYFPAPLEKLVEQFAKLPGIGGKSAQRLAFYVLSLPETEAQEFAERARELGDISAAGEEAAHTSIDAYFGDSTDGGVHPDVAEAVRAMEMGQVSDPIETQDGWYVVQRVSDYDESATEENLEAMAQQAKEAYLMELERQWQEETPLEIDEEIWDAVRVDQMLTEP